MRLRIGCWRSRDAGPGRGRKQRRRPVADAAGRSCDNVRPERQLRKHHAAPSLLIGHWLGVDAINQVATPRRDTPAVVRIVWTDLEHLRVLDTDRLSGLGLEPVLTTSELAEYLGLQVQAIYDLRTDGRGPSGIRVGREIRYRASDVRRSAGDGLHQGVQYGECVVGRLGD